MEASNKDLARARFKQQRRDAFRDGRGRGASKWPDAEVRWFVGRKWGRLSCRARLRDSRSFTRQHLRVRVRSRGVPESEPSPRCSPPAINHLPLCVKLVYGREDARSAHRRPLFFSRLRRDLDEELDDELDEEPLSLPDDEDDDDEDEDDEDDEDDEESLSLSLSLSLSVSESLLLLLLLLLPLLLLELPRRRFRFSFLSFDPFVSS